MLKDAIQKSSSALLFTSALSFPEFIEQNEFYGELLCAGYNEARLPAAAQLQFAQYPDTLNLLVVAAEDAPDTIMVLPILQRIAEASPRLDLHIVCEDDDLTRLMSLVDDSDLLEEWDEMDTPLLLIFDEEWQYQANWGPRPQAAEEKLDQWLTQHPEYEELADSDDDAAQITYNQLLHKLTYEMRVWYNSDLRRACADEIADLLQSIQSESDSDDEDAESDDSEQDNVQVELRQDQDDKKTLNKEKDDDRKTSESTQDGASRGNQGGRSRGRQNSGSDGDRGDGGNRRRRRSNNRRNDNRRSDRRSDGRSDGRSSRDGGNRRRNSQRSRTQK